MVRVNTDNPTGKNKAENPKQGRNMFNYEDNPPCPSRYIIYLWYDLGIFPAAQNELSIIFTYIGRAGFIHYTGEHVRTRVVYIYIYYIIYIIYTLYSIYLMAPYGKNSYIRGCQRQVRVR